MNRLTNLLRQRTWLADLSALAALLAYAALLWQSAHNQSSVLDEGLYLYKGWLFASGKYTPFQDYGLWTNQMPLAFLIPGWIELLFGPGLRTGRIFAFTLGILTALGLWATSRRLAGRWIAAGLVLALALNPAAIRMVSMAASQGLIACLLAWTMFFSLGNDRRPWQLFIGGLLAGTAVMVRINMLPLLPFLLLYIWWARGWKSAAWLLAGEILVFGAIHWAYWPNILRLWARWLPLPFLQPWFPPPNTLPEGVKPVSSQAISFFQAFRYHFTAMIGMLVTWILWPAKLDTEKRKILVYLSVMLLFLIAAHAWASLGHNYCVFCFPTYTAFYSSLGLLMLAISIPAWQLDIARWRAISGSLLIIILLGGMGYTSEGIVTSLIDKGFYKYLLSLSVPGMKGIQIWQLIVNKFKLESDTFYDIFQSVFQTALVVAFGLLVFCACILFMRKKNLPAVSGLSLGLIVMLAVGTLLSPIALLAGGYTTYDCPTDVIKSYESVGEKISGQIPAGAQVYWVGFSPVVLLYSPQAGIYPPQLHGSYSNRKSKDSDALLRVGWMNTELSNRWFNEADFVLIYYQIFREFPNFQTRINNQYDLIISTRPVSCSPDSEFLLFRRK